MARINLNEIISVKGQLIETDGRRLPKGVLCKVAYPICNIGEKNQNNRVYSKEVWEKVLANEDLQRKMKERTLFGQAEHPAETQSDLQLTSHVVTRTWMDESTNRVMQEMDVLNTPCGKIIDTLLEAGCLVGVSTRAEGELEEMNETEGETYFNVIPESYMYVATDFTADPSTFDVTPAKYERSVVKDIRAGLETKKLDKHFATILLESMESKEAKKVLEMIQKEDKKKEVARVDLRVKVIEGDYKNKTGIIDEIKENRISLNLDDGTTISIEASKVVTDDGQVEIMLPTPEPMAMETEPMIEPEMDELPPEEETDLSGEPVVGTGIEDEESKVNPFESKMTESVGRAIVSGLDPRDVNDMAEELNITSKEVLRRVLDAYETDLTSGGDMGTLEAWLGDNFNADYLTEAKMGVDSVKDVKVGIKQAAVAIKDKDYDKAAEILDDIADDAAHGAKAARKMKRANDTKASDDKKKADEAAKELDKDLTDKEDKALVDAIVDEDQVDEFCEFSVSYKDKTGETKKHAVKASDAIEAGTKAQEALGEEAKITSVDVVSADTVPESKIEEEEGIRGLGDRFYKSIAMKVNQILTGAGYAFTDEAILYYLHEEMSQDEVSYDLRDAVNSKDEKMTLKLLQGLIAMTPEKADAAARSWREETDAFLKRMHKPGWGASTYRGPGKPSAKVESKIEEEEEEVAEKIVQVDGKWQVQSESGKNLGTYDSKEEADKRLGQVEYFKKNESIIINDTVRELRIKEATMKAEREKAIELLEELEKKTESSDKSKTLEIRVLLNKLRDIQLKESREVIALRRMIETRSRSLQIAIKTVEGLQKLHKKAEKDFAKLKEQVKEQDIKIKQIAEEYVTKLRDKTAEIEESYKTEFIKCYTNFKIESSGLNVHESSRALLEKKSTVEEVDAIFEEIRDAMRRGALHVASLQEVEVEQTETKDPLRKNIKSVIRSTGF